MNHADRRALDWWCGATEQPPSEGRTFLRHATGGVAVFCGVPMYRCVCTGKNLTKLQLHENILNTTFINSMETQDYYTRNKEARKEYQREYYKKNKERIRRKRKLEELENPSKFTERKNYNSEYYQRNKEKILKRRKEHYDKRKTESKPVS